jgi:hypothetical protein
MDALNYKDILSSECYENLRQAALDLKVREMVNAGCVWHIIWTGLVDSPFEFDPGDPDHVALLARSAAREREGQTVPEVLTEIAKLVLEWVTPGFATASGNSLESLVTDAHRGHIFARHQAT